VSRPGCVLLPAGEHEALQERAARRGALLLPPSDWRPDWEARLNGTTTTFISAEQVSAWLEMLEAGDVRH
jgi:hypothetical protein